VGWITGRVYGYNTAGAVIGALLGGFVFIPLFGSLKSLAAIAVLFLFNGWYLSRKTSNKGLISNRLILSLSSVFLVLSLFLPQKLILNYNLQNLAKSLIVCNLDGIGHTVSVIKRENGVTIMAIGGNVEADTSFTQRRHFILKGHLPLLLHEHPNEVAVIGLGLGITLSATARHPEVEKVQLIELSPEMVAAHNYLKELTGDILNNSKIQLLIDDGRNFFSMTNKKFDMITADPIHPRISGVGYLYTQEYFHKIKACLKPGGVVCQWMPMYHISPESFNVAFRTFSSVFDNAFFWYVRGHGLFVATTGEPIDYQQFSRRFASAAVSGDMSDIDIENGEKLLSYMLMGPREIHAYLEKFNSKTINKDDNAYLEYFTPFEYLGKTKAIVEKLLPFARLDLDLIRDIPDDKKEIIKRNWEIRQKEILPELDRPLR
jgi:spermidine synthase